MTKSLKKVAVKLFSMIASQPDRSERFKRKLVLKKIGEVVKTARKEHPDKQVVLLSDAQFGNKTVCPQIRDIKDIKDDLKKYIFVLFYTNDSDYEKPLELIRKSSGVFYAIPIEKPVAEFKDKNKRVKKTLERTKNDVLKYNLSKFDSDDFQNIMQAIEITREVKGDYLEIGVYKGSSALAALYYMKDSNIKRSCWFLDTYEGFSYSAAENSFDRRWFKTHKLWGKNKTVVNIKKLLARTKIPNKVIATDICFDNLSRGIKSIAVCNIDVDMYDAVLASLSKTAPLIERGGIIIAEDYGHTPGLIGAHLAVKNFLLSNLGKFFTPIYMESGQLFLIKK